MAADRFKTAARKIVNFALNVDGAMCSSTEKPFPRSDVLVLENLATLLPASAKESGINRALMEFNRGHLVDRIKEVAADCGLRVILVSPVGTSQVCSRCGALGRRYSIRKGPNGSADILFGFVEKLFACPCCGYRANADHNASINLTRTFLYGDKTIKSFRDWQGRTAKERSQAVQQIERSLLSRLRLEHHLDSALATVREPL